MGHNDSVAGPTKLTPGLRAELERELGDGVPVAVAARPATQASELAGAVSTRPARRVLHS